MWKKKLAIIEIIVIVLLLLTAGFIYIIKQRSGRTDPPGEAALAAASGSEEASGEKAVPEPTEEAAAVSAGSTGTAASSENEETSAASAQITEDPEAAAVSEAASGLSAASSEREESAAVSAVEAEPQTSADLYADKPDIDINSWEFLLANYENNIEEYVPETAELEGVELDARIIEPMTSFIEDCRAAGNTVLLASGYRDYYTQQYLFDLECTMYDEETAATIVARPGTSEHQTGLAADITDTYYEYKTSDLQYTSMYQWMEAHCHEYGFIVRFPEGKEDITKIIYEPWHFRYVGVEAATYIMEHDLTLEEFIDLYK